MMLEVLVMLEMLAGDAGFFLPPISALGWTLLRIKVRDRCMSAWLYAL